MSFAPFSKNQQSLSHALGLPKRNTTLQAFSLVLYVSLVSEISEDIHEWIWVHDANKVAETKSEEVRVMGALSVVLCGVGGPKTSWEHCNILIWDQERIRVTYRCSKPHHRFGMSHDLALSPRARYVNPSLRLLFLTHDSRICGEDQKATQRSEWLFGVFVKKHHLRMHVCNFQDWTAAKPSTTSLWPCPGPRTGYINPSLAPLLSSIWPPHLRENQKFMDPFPWFSGVFLSKR